MIMEDTRTKKLNIKKIYITHRTMYLLTFRTELKITKNGNNENQT